jgi:hypothetical protein
VPRESPLQHTLGDCPSSTSPPFPESFLPPVSMPRFRWDLNHVALVRADVKCEMVLAQRLTNSTIGNAKPFNWRFFVEDNFRFTRFHNWTAALTKRGMDHSLVSIDQLDITCILLLHCMIKNCVSSCPIRVSSDSPSRAFCSKILLAHNTCLLKALARS